MGVGVPRVPKTPWVANGGDLDPTLKPKPKRPGRAYFPGYLRALGAERTEGAVSSKCTLKDCEPVSHELDSSN